MHITRVIIKNYRCLQTSDVELNNQLNILVGNNECGKSTFLEAINLALTCQLNGRPIHGELHPHLFNAEVVARYIDSLKTTSPIAPPSIVIELYFNDVADLAALKGTNNSRKSDSPGVVLCIEFNETDYKEEYKAYVEKPELVRAIPVEYYRVIWRSFTGNNITWRSVPIKTTLVDASTIRNDFAANRYIADMIKGCLDRKQQVDLALTYRLMKDRSLEEDSVKKINTTLATKRSGISDKQVTVSLDTSSRTGWESGIMTHLDEIPMPLIGKGEQNSIKIKLAMESGEDSHIFLIEEPENHLSFTKLNILISSIAKRKAGKQLIITTHSSFVLNKLGIDSVLLYKNGIGKTLHGLNKDTEDYFIKLPGHETLRMILASRAILVEGPSDELIVQRAYRDKHAKMPLEDGVDVITVNSLAFKRFLEIATLLGITVDVITDNDADTTALEKKYGDYLGTKAKPNIKIQYDSDLDYPTLEPQLLKANGLSKLNEILDTKYGADAELLKYMSDNKTDCALRLFQTEKTWVAPEYIKRAF